MLIDGGYVSNVQVEGFLKSESFIRAMAAIPMPTSHPFGPPAVGADGTITVPVMLRQPQRITRMIMDLTQERFIADRIFAGGGGVTGGAVVYDVAQENELYPNRDVEIIAPAGEFPLITSEMLKPEVAEVEKWGAKTFVTDEARDRNDTAGFVKLMRQLANSFVLKMNKRAIEYLNVALAGGSRDILGNNWAAYDPEVDPPTQSPAYDFGRAEMQAANEEMGISYNLWLVNPQEALMLTAIYGPALNAPGMPNFYSSPRVPAGEAYAVAERQVGQAKIEKPLGTVTYREDKTERTWVQSSVRPLWFVDNLFAILHFKALDGTP